MKSPLLHTTKLAYTDPEDSSGFMEQLKQQIHTDQMSGIAAGSGVLGGLLAGTTLPLSYLVNAPMYEGGLAGKGVASVGTIKKFLSDQGISPAEIAVDLGKDTAIGRKIEGTGIGYYGRNPIRDLFHKAQAVNGNKILPGKFLNTSRGGIAVTKLRMDPYVAAVTAGRAGGNPIFPGILRALRHPATVGLSQLAGIGLLGKAISDAHEGEDPNFALPAVAVGIPAAALATDEIRGAIKGLALMKRRNMFGGAKPFPTGMLMSHMGETGLKALRRALPISLAALMAKKIYDKGVDFE